MRSLCDGAGLHPSSTKLDSSDQERNVFPGHTRHASKFNLAVKFPFHSIPFIVTQSSFANVQSKYIMTFTVDLRPTFFLSISISLWTKRNQAADVYRNAKNQMVNSEIFAARSHQSLAFP